MDGPQADVVQAPQRAAEASSGMPASLGRRRGGGVLGDGVVVPWLAGGRSSLHACSSPTGKSGKTRTGHRAIDDLRRGPTEQAYLFPRTPRDLLAPSPETPRQRGTS